MASSSQTVLRMKPDYFDAVIEGNFMLFKDCERLDLLQDPGQNNILHIYIIAQAKRQLTLFSRISVTVRMMIPLFSRIFGIAKQIDGTNVDLEMDVDLEMEACGRPAMKEYMEEMPVCRAEAKPVPKEEMVVGCAEASVALEEEVSVACAKEEEGVALNEEEEEEENSSDASYPPTSFELTIQQSPILSQLKSSADNSPFPFVTHILIKCPRLLFQVNSKRETPLHLAVRFGDLKLVELLIQVASILMEEQSLLRRQTIDRDLVLHEAVRKNHFEVLKLLIEKDEDLCGFYNKNNESPLYLAAEKEYWDCFSKLLDCSSPAFKGPNGQTALHAVVMKNNAVMVAKLLEKEKSLTQMVNKQGLSPLHLASHLGYVDIVKMLLDVDESAAYLREYEKGQTALHIASSRGSSHIMVMKTIIEKSPLCCEMVDRAGWSVLHYAVESFNVAGVNFLLEHPFFYYLINRKDFEGNTPLHLLARLGFNIRSLIYHPMVDKQAENNQNLTPLDVIMDAQEKEFNWSAGGTIRSLKKAGFKENGNKKLHFDHKEGILKRAAILIGMVYKWENAHLLVVTLIATCAFAAAFTIPGGFVGEKGEDEGTPVLSKEVSFHVFMVLITIAITTSVFAIFIDFFLVAITSKRKAFWLIAMSFILTMSALICLFEGVMAGIYVVMRHSGTRYVVLISSFYFPILCVSVARYVFNNR